MLEFSEIYRGLNLEQAEISALHGFLTFKEEPEERLSELLLLPDGVWGKAVEDLIRKGVVQRDNREGKSYYSLAPLEKWAIHLKSSAHLDQEKLELELSLLEKAIQYRLMPSITVVSSREIRQKEAFVPEVQRYTTTIFPCVDLRLGTKCNMNCLYCLLGKEKGYSRPFHEIIDDLRFAREQNLEKVSLTGGEPTLHKDILKIIASAKVLGFKMITLVTNGVVLSQGRNFEKVVEAGITSIGISLDTSDKETQEKLWRSHGFEKVIDTFRQVARFEHLLVGSIAVITKLNYKQLPDLAKLLVELKSTMQNLFVPTLDFVMPEENAWVNRELIVPRLTDVVPYVKEALEFAHSSGLPLTFRGIPLCLIPQYERYSYDRYMSIFRILKGENTAIYDRLTLDIRRVKPQTCRRCKYFRECTGVLRAYANIYGLEELSPVEKDA